MTEKARANPTRRFFVDILTRDISLKWSILDLIDNSVDSFRSKHGDALQGCRIDVGFSNDHFEITDNAEGISLDNAKNYAFSFGRRDDAERVEGAIGLYGVGMKRAIFKIGRHFKLTSRTSETSLSMTVDVNKWLEDSATDWSFDFEVDQPSDMGTGTSLIVNQLSEPIANELRSPRFEQDLRETAQKTYGYILQDGLEITINSKRLIPDVPSMAMSEELQPKVVTKQVDGVKMRLVAGVYSEASEGPNDPDDTGWTVLCNGRAILLADRTALTGWGSKEEGETDTPKYHGQYARFRGLVWLDSADSLKLPWNTTKTAIDGENRFFRSVVLPEMKAAVRSVVDYLNKLKAESDAMNTSDEGYPEVYGQVLRDAKSTSDLRNLTASQDFSVTPKVDVVRISYTNVQFRKESSLVRRAVKKYGAASASKLSESLFDKFVKEYDLDVE
jgi:hypothetical protein